MTQHLPAIVENAQWVLFAWILANQGGVPVPGVPALFAVGALIASGRLSVVTTMVGNQDTCIDRALLADGPGECPAGSVSLP